MKTFEDVMSSMFTLLEGGEFNTKHMVDDYNEQRQHAELLNALLNFPFDVRFGSFFETEIVPGSVTLRIRSNDRVGIELIFVPKVGTTAYLTRRAMVFSTTQRPTGNLGSLVDIMMLHEDRTLTSMYVRLNLEGDGFDPEDFVPYCLRFSVTGSHA